MLIYSKDNDIVSCTQVILGANSSNVSKSNHIWDKHRHMTDKLENGKDVLVTGGTYASAIYTGKFEPRNMFIGYLNDTV
jgi:hypothetical protein